MEALSMDAADPTQAQFAANVWGKPGLHVRCDDCGVALVPEAGDAGDTRKAGDTRGAGVAVGLRAA
jgi:hypothetical protein